jgi:hypothetical protein
MKIIPAMMGLESWLSATASASDISTILIDLPSIWMHSRSPVRTHMPFLQP